MTPQQAEEIIQNSIRRLLERDPILLTNDVSERAITHKLAQYVQCEVERIGIADVHVDCEYNRNLVAGPLQPKRVQLLEQRRQDELQRGDLSEDDWRSVTTFPDIIVHRRGDNGRNLLVIEVKKSTNPTGEAFDHMKLRAFTEHTDQNLYHYAFGVFILIETGGPKLRRPDLKWFRDGREA